MSVFKIHCFHPVCSFLRNEVQEQWDIEQNIDEILLLCDAALNVEVYSYHAQTIKAYFLIEIHKVDEAREMLTDDLIAFPMAGLQEVRLHCIDQDYDMALEKLAELEQKQMIFSFWINRVYAEIYASQNDPRNELRYLHRAMKSLQEPSIPKLELEGEIHKLSFNWRVIRHHLSKL